MKPAELRLDALSQQLRNEAPQAFITVVDYPQQRALRAALLIKDAPEMIGCPRAVSRNECKTIPMLPVSF